MKTQTLMSQKLIQTCYRDQHRLKVMDMVIASQQPVLFNPPLPTGISPHDSQGQTDWSCDGQPHRPTCPSLPSGLSMKLSDQILDFNDEDLDNDRGGQNPEQKVGEEPCKNQL